MAYVKYLLLLSLLVLGLTLLSGAAFAQDSWAVTGQDVPSALVWDQSASASVVANNDGTTTWDDTYGLASTDATPVVIDRWGVPAVQVVDTVAPDADYTFDFTVKAFPLTTLAYPLPVGVSPGVIAGFVNNYVMFNGSGLITPPMAENTTVVTRFNDIHIGVPANDNFAFYIEELAGRVPAITTGFTDGTFRPVAKVTRGQMGAFMQRALGLPLLPYAGTFADVPSDYFAAQAIEACVTAGVATGFAIDNTFRPLLNVKRNQMAVFLARGLVGGEAFVPTYTGTADFSDVIPGDFGYNHIEYCFQNGVTTGFKDGTFLPLNNVTRGQMAAFLYRAFIQPTDSVVVLGGPAFTEVDPATAGYDGWPSVSFLASGVGAANAYVAFDAARFGETQPDFDVSFAIYDAADTLVDESGPITVDVGTARAAAYASGNPYAYATWAVSGLADGQYKLLTTVNGTLLAREVPLAVGSSGLIAGAFDQAAIAAATWDMVSGRVVSDGSDADLAASDDAYLVTMRDRQPDWRDDDGGDWCSNGNHATSLIWKGIPADAATLELTLEYHVNNPNDGSWQPDCCDTSCCGDWGELDYWDLPTLHPAAYSYQNDPENSPLGWGLSVQTGDVDGGEDWWNADGDGGDPEIFTLVGSGDPMVPSTRDVVGGGDMFPSQGFTGFARDTDVVEQWGTTNVAGYVNANGDFVVTFCGGSIYELYIDQAVIEYTK